MLQRELRYCVYNILELCVVLDNPVLFLGTWPTLRALTYVLCHYTDVFSSLTVFTRSNGSVVTSNVHKNNLSFKKQFFEEF